MNNENFQEPERRTWTPVMIIMGVQGQEKFLWKNEKFNNSVLKDVLNVSIDHLNVVLRLTKSGR